MNYGYDPVEDLLKVTSIQKKWRDGFATAALDSRKWTSQVAPGGGISVASGALRNTCRPKPSTCCARLASSTRG